MSNEENKVLDTNKNSYVIKFATITCLICALLVSVAAVALRGIQNQNKLNEKRLNILIASGLAERGVKLSNGEIDERFKNIVPVVVNLQSGELAPDIDPASYDMYAVAKSPQGEALKEDPASIQRIAKNGSAYLVMDGDKLKNVVIPIQGYGLWSTMYGFTALDLTATPVKIVGISFYQHAETPGLGGEIVNPTWQVKWNNKIPFDDNGRAVIKLNKTGAKNDHEVDSLSGATLTSRGVENMVNFWLGPTTYKPFIDNLQAGKIDLAKLKK